MKPAAALLSCLTVILPAQEGRWHTELNIHFASIKSPGALTPPAYAVDAKDIVGAGFELARVVSLNRCQELRGSFGFTGIYLGGWSEPDPSTGYTRDMYVNWRTMRFGLDHLLYPKPGIPVYLVAGAGLQESWVAKSEGNLLFLAMANIAAATVGANANYNYAAKGSSLDGWDGYWQLGLGCRVLGGMLLEAKVVRARHREYRNEGPALEGDSPVVERWGSTFLACVGGRF
jgi:hypothetical protein